MIINLKKNKVNISLLLLTIISALISYFNIKDINYEISSVVIIPYIIIVVILLITLIVINRKQEYITNNYICYVFLILGIALGAFYIALSPLFSGSDEHNHYYRIYEIATGSFKTKTNDRVGSKLPASLEKTFIAGSGFNTSIKYHHINNMLEVPLKKDEKIQYGQEFTSFYSNTALYSPFSYVPHLIGFKIGDVLNLNPYIIGMLGRVTNLLVYLSLGFLILNIALKAKMFLLAILLSPNMLQCATTLSADAFTNVILLLFISLIFKIKSEKKEVKLREKIYLLILALLITQCKIVYLPAIFLIFLLPKNQYKYKMQEKWIYSSILIIISIIIGLLWMNSTSEVFDISYNKTALQKDFIFSNIFRFTLIFIKTFYIYGFKYFECLFVGTTMYHSQIEMPIIISLLYTIIVIISLLQESDKRLLKPKEKYFVGLIMLVIVGLISTAIYIQCTAQYYSVGNSIIEGIQGRYFVPVILMLPYLLNFKLRTKKISNCILINTIISLNLITYIYMIERFIV